MVFGLLPTHYAVYDNNLRIIKIKVFTINTYFLENSI